MSHYQARVKDWLLSTFGEEIAEDRVERIFRFLEEALELAQAAGVTHEELLVIAEYVYNRSEGEVKQEVGGVIVCLSAFCSTFDIDMMQAAEDELARCWRNKTKIQRKHAAKPKDVRSPLPGNIEE